jgi:hypothetical protein
VGTKPLSTLPCRRTASIRAGLTAVFAAETPDPQAGRPTAMRLSQTVRLMKILITGASGRVGRALYVRLCTEHEVIGYDTSPSSTADVVAPLEETEQLRAAIQGTDAVVHASALHAPHVGLRSDSEFESGNVRCTGALIQLAIAS